MLTLNLAHQVGAAIGFDYTTGSKFTPKARLRVIFSNVWDLHVIFIRVNISFLVFWDFDDYKIHCFQIQSGKISLLDINMHKDFSCVHPA